MSFLTQFNKRFESFYQMELSKKEEEALREILTRFITSYLENKDKMILNEWLVMKLKEELPNFDSQELEKFSEELIQSLKDIESSRQNLESANQRGISTNTWFKQQIKNTNLAEKDLQELEKVLDENIQFNTLDLAMQSDPNLENTLEPKILEKPQEKPNLSQTFEEMGQKVMGSAIVGASNSAKKYLEKTALNEIEIKKLFDTTLKGGKKGIQDSLKEILEKTTKPEDVFGIKTATGGALKSAVEKGILKKLPIKSGGVLGAIANIAVNNTKTFIDIAKGEKTISEGVDEIGKTAASAFVGNIGRAKGASLGAIAGSILGPIGSTVGAIVGGTLGGIAGSEVGQTLYNGAKKIISKTTDAVVSGVKAVGSAISSGVRAVGNAVSSFCSSVCSFLGF